MEILFEKRDFKEICLMYITTDLLQKELSAVCVSILSWLEQQTSVIKPWSISYIYRVCWEWWGGIWKSQNSAFWFPLVLWAPVIALYLTVCQNLHYKLSFPIKLIKQTSSRGKHYILANTRCFLFGLALKTSAWWNWVSAVLHFFSSLPVQAWKLEHRYHTQQYLLKNTKGYFSWELSVSYMLSEAW